MENGFSRRLMRQKKKAIHSRRRIQAGFEIKRVNMKTFLYRILFRGGRVKCLCPPIEFLSANSVRSDTYFAAFSCVEK